MIMKRKFITVLFFLSAQIVLSQTTEEWITYFEKSGFVSTSDYQETMIYFKKLAKFSQYAKMKSSWLLILNEKPDKVMITIKITDAIIILMMFNCSDHILREASVNAIEVPDHRKAVRSAINSPYKI